MLTYHTGSDRTRFLGVYCGKEAFITGNCPLSILLAVVDCLRVVEMIGGSRMQGGES